MLGRRVQAILVAFASLSLAAADSPTRLSISNAVGGVEVRDGAGDAWRPARMREPLEPGSSCAAALARAPSCRCPRAWFACSSSRCCAAGAGGRRRARGAAPRRGQLRHPTPRSGGAVRGPHAARGGPGEGHPLHGDRGSRRFVGLGLARSARRARARQRGARDPRPSRLRGDRRRRAAVRARPAEPEGRSLAGLVARRRPVPPHAAVALARRRPPRRATRISPCRRARTSRSACSRAACRAACTSRARPGSTRSSRAAT